MRVLISCGEASGEEYAVDLVRALRSKRPELELCGVGGDALAAAGVPLWARREDLAVMGFGEVIRHLPRLRALRDRLAKRALAERIDLFLPIDYGGFHISLATRLHREGIGVLDFIPPKTWSWGTFRVRKLRGAVDQCAVLFDFEVEHYRAHGVQAHWVGHPLVERIPLRAEAARQGILIVPGSREQELRRIAPILADAIRRLKSQFPAQPVRVSKAPGVREEWLRPLMATDLDVDLCSEPLADLARTTQLAIVTSGTATLETALCRTPHLIVYRTSALSYAIARRLAHVQHIGMANIVLGRRAFPEYLQSALAAAPLARAAAELLADSRARAEQERACDELRRRLGEPGAMGRVADLALAMLDR